MSTFRASSDSLTHSSSSPTSPSSNGVLNPVPPSNSQIEAVIQMATSAAAADSRVPGRDTRTQLFVGNLPYRVRWQDLKDLFRKSGTVLRADVSLGPDNRSRGYGTVLLATSEDAARAVDMFNGYNWQTRTLEVRPDRLPPEYDGPMSSMAVNLVSLPPAVSGQALPISVHSAVYGNSLGNSLGDSVMSTSGHDDLEVSQLHGERARTSSIGSKSLFVGNLPFQCQWQDLKDLFRQAGTIVRADVALGPDGRSRGFGTVSFANDADAERALNIFNGYEYNGRSLKVHYDKYSQVQVSQSPIPLSSLPPSTQVQPSHPNAPSHISLPMPPPLTTFEQFVSGHQSTSPYEHPFGQISPYDIYPPHIAAIAGNAAAQVYMNNRPRTPPVAAPEPEPLVTSKTMNSLFPPVASNESLQNNATSEKTDAPATVSAKSPSSNHVPAHPGPIALPSPSIHPFANVSGPVSPLQGLPPITPSMPTFTFVPQNATPPLNAHFLSPGIGLSPFSPPGNMSPGSFYHPASNQRPHMGHVWNLAPGAPVQMHSPMGSPGSPGYYVMSQHAPGSEAGVYGGSPGMGMGMTDYFSVPPPAPSLPSRVSEGYFPPVSVLRSSGLSNEIMKEESRLERVGVSGGEGSSVLGAVVGSDRKEGCEMENGGEKREEVAAPAAAGLEVQQQMACMTLGNVPVEGNVSAAPKVDGPVPHRTRSDGEERKEVVKPKDGTGMVDGDVTAPWNVHHHAMNGMRGEWMGPNSGASSSLGLGERRASWTPEASRREFRRGLGMEQRGVGINGWMD